MDAGKARAELLLELTERRRAQVRPVVGRDAAVVTFRLHAVHVIEVEQLNGSDDAPRRLGRALLDRYPDRLELSTMGKYSLGGVMKPPTP